MSIKQQTKRYGLFLFLPTVLLAQTGTGLKGDYFTNTTLSGVVAVSKTDPTINFEWGYNVVAAPGIPLEKFSIRWTGQVEAPVAGAYTFVTQSDDGVRLWVDGKLLVNRWNDHGSTRDQSVPVSLVAGRKYDIQLEYYENTGASVIKLRWAYPGQVEQAIPQGRLYVTPITLQVAPVPVSRTFVSSLPFLSSTNGWGPVERDRSNGETGATDGKTLKLDGVSYSRGLGAHARSEIRIALDDRYDVFKAMIGVDDEVGNNGSVVFEVYLDGVRKFQSPTMRGNTPAMAVSVPTENAVQLRLVVTDAGDGIGHDHADWADAQLEGVERINYLSDLRWMSATNGRGEVVKDSPMAATAGGKVPERFMLRGQSYAKGLGVMPASEVKYNLDKKFERFSAVVGIDDTALGRGSAIFEVWSGTTMLYKSDRLTGTSAPQHVSLMVLNRTELTLKVTDAGDGNVLDIADWANARLLPIGSDGPIAPPPPPTTAPAIPTELSAVPGNALINLSWKAATGATSYNVYRGSATNAQAAMPIATNVTGLTFSNTGLTNGTPHFYKVRAVNNIGMSNPSNEATATPTVVIAPAVPGAPVNLTATPGNASVSLAWQAVTGATGYNVLRSTTANSPNPTTIASNRAGTTFNDAELTNGTTYFYRVRAVNAVGAGNASNEVSARPVAPTPPPPTAPTAAPTNVTATAGLARVTLGWAAVAGASSYNVFRGTAANAQATTPVASNVTALTFANTGLTNGTTYFYKVVGVNAGGNGPASAEVSATPVTTPAAPVLVSAVGGDGRVTLRWNAVPTAASYSVYRAITTNGQTTAVLTGITTLTVENTGLTNGTGYFFRVSAVNGAGEGGRSNEMAATPGGNAPPVDPATLSAFRLLRQASWGPKPGEVDRVKNIGRTAYLDEQLGIAPSQYPDTLNTMSVEDVQEHFFRVALTGNDQLRQRMAFALSKIWAVNADDVNRADATVAHYRIFMNDAFGNYRQLMTDVTLNPAMGRFLNNLNSRSEAVTNAPAVENFARELLQLFTLGTVVMDNNGNPQPGSPYTIDDIRGLARLFTGWTFGDGNPATIPTNAAGDNWRVPMEPVNRFHDVTAKNFLGTSFPPGRTAREDLDAALDLIFQHPNLPPYVAKGLIQSLVTSNPSPAYIGAVSAAFINNGSGVRGDLRAVLRAILTHPEANLGTNSAGKLMEPVLMVVSPLRTLNATVSDFPFMADLSEQMGQKVFYPPTVFSYFSPFYKLAGTMTLAPEFEILTSVTILSRINYMGRVLNADLNGSTTIDYAAFTSQAADASALVDYVALQFMGGQISTEHRNAAIAAVNITAAANTTERVRTAIYVVLGSAQYQVDR